MKKLKLNLQNIEGIELLTKAQLKNVLGGTNLDETTTTTTTGMQCYCCDGYVVGESGDCEALEKNGCTYLAESEADCNS
ncbi:hypothetical protein [Niabella aurantiaca]|uniref:hypothetical protein n=1 Tax=Niabella aurantiaca TaxID=379900 RepID=UPI000377C990|nr:hypothetical protein [Niabella aurantiaca]